MVVIAGWYTGIPAVIRVRFRSYKCLRNNRVYTEYTVSNLVSNFADEIKLTQN